MPRFFNTAGPDPEPQGLEQLGAYLQTLGLDRGALLIFDQRQEASPSEGSFEKRQVEGRQVCLLRL